MSLGLQKWPRLAIHASLDDQVTGPSGSNGDRITCGVIVAAPATLPATGGQSYPPVACYSWLACGC